MRLKSYPLALLILIPSDVRAQQAASICMKLGAAVGNGERGHDPE